jgi:putative glutamine amidotransferase
MGTRSQYRPPRIGLTTYGRDDATRYGTPLEYVDAVRRGGGSVVLLPPGEADPLAHADELDGLILIGGGDVNPSRYGGAGHPAVYNVDDERDEHEFALARYALQHDLPTLAICRGMQIVNVLLGGTLHAHVPDVFGDSVLHRAPPRAATSHAVRVEAGSRLANTVGADEFECVSWHHQAIDTVAADFAVVACAPDALIEAVELPSHPWLIGVQWHPELTASTDPAQQRLFDGFVDAARAHSARR